MDPEYATYFSAGWKSAAVDHQQRLISGMVTTTDVDMVGDVVLPEGMDDKTYFADTRNVDLEHDSERPVGHNRNIKAIPGRGVHTTTHIGRHPLGNDVLTMVEDGVIRGLSIEWDNRTLVAGPPTEDERKRYGDGCKRVFRKWTLTSYALTARPMNSKCLIEMDTKSAAWLDEQNKIWERCRKLVDTGKIRAASAKAIGLPDNMLSRKEKRRVMVVGGLVFRRVVHLSSVAADR